MNPLKELAKLLFRFHNNYYIKKLGFPSFSVFDPMCSRKNGFSFDFDFDFFL